ncbi:MAG: hypothetical protein Q7R89_02160 [bacterium]|nr:hypothetical protein [bacterium]
MRRMKKIIIIIIVVAIAALLYTMRDNSPRDKTVTPTVSEKGVFRPDPSSATFIFDDEEITLSAGRNEKSITPGNALVEETVLMDKFAYGDINADGKEDTVLFLARYGGGSGTFIYLGAYVSGPVTYRGSRAILIGDRIVPQSISINKGIITIKYLDRKEDEPFSAEPTVSISKQFIYKNGELVEK